MMLVVIPFLERQASISFSLSLDIISGCAQPNLPVLILTCTQPSFVRFPVTATGSLTDWATLSRNATGSERRLPLTKIKQSLLSGNAEGLGLGSWLELCPVGDGCDERLGDDEMLFA